MTTTLADLDTNLTVHSDAVPAYARHAARKALARIAQAAGAEPSAIPADEALQRHAALKDHMADAGGWREEHTSIIRLLALPALPADVAGRVRAGAASLDDVLAAIELRADWGAERARVRGAVQRFADTLRQRSLLSDVRAVEAVIARHLSRLSHLDFAIQAASFAVFKSRVRRGIRLVDVTGRTQVSRSLMSGAWRRLVDAAGDTGTVAKIWPLVSYCTRRDIAPEAVTDETIAALWQDLDERGRNGFDAARAAVYAWQALQRDIPVWPTTPLSRLYRSRRAAFAVPYAALPESLRQDWEEFCRRFVRAKGETEIRDLADLIGDDGPIGLPDAPDVDGTYTPERLTNMRTVVTALANAAIASGAAPATVADIITKANAERAITDLYVRQRAAATAAGRSFNPKNNTALNMITNTISLARAQACSSAIIDALVDLRDRVDPRLKKRMRNPRTGEWKREYLEVQIGPRHRERVAAFNNPTTLHAWFRLPALLTARVAAVAKSGKPLKLEDCNDAMVLVLYGVMLCCPARRENLAALRVAGQDPNIVMPLARQQTGRLHVDWTQVKNLVNLDAELDPFAVTALRLWLEYFRPALMSAVGSDPANPYLFPAKAMQHRDGVVLNRHFVDRNRKLGGFVLNLHCMRHLTAKVILDERPTAMELVQQILGHSRRQTTERYYAEVNRILVQREYQSLLLARRNKVYGELPWPPATPIPAMR